jgi:hypothetical protein
MLLKIEYIQSIPMMPKGDTFRVIRTRKYAIEVAVLDHTKDNLDRNRLWLVKTDGNDEYYIVDMTVANSRRIIVHEITQEQLEELTHLYGGQPLNL